MRLIRDDITARVQRLLTTLTDAWHVPHQMEIMRNGKLEKTFPVSLGKKGYETPNGTY